MACWPSPAGTCIRKSVDIGGRDEVHENRFVFASCASVSGGGDCRPWKKDGEGGKNLVAHCRLPSEALEIQNYWSINKVWARKWYY